MASPRQLGRGLFARLVARVLIAVLLFSLVPLQAQASIPKSALPDPRPTEDLAAATKPARLLVVVVVGEPIWLTKSAFGELLGHSGTDPQPYAFAGEPYDPNSGFQYHRARWMDPRVGRFVGMDRHPGVVWDPQTLHKYLYAAADPANKIDPSGLFLTLPEIGGILSSLSTLAAIAIPRFQAVLSFVSLNFFTIQRTIEYVEFGANVIGATFAAVDIVERMATSLSTTNLTYPAGNGPRGLQVGRIAGQNLADNFPTVDHFEDGAVVSIKSTTAIEDQGRLLQNIGNWAAEMDDVGPLRGRTADGRPITITSDQIRTRGLLIAIPHEPLPWNAAAFMGQVRRISQLYRTSIRVVTVRGLRGQ